MSKSFKAITYAIGAIIGLLVLTAIALSLFLDINAYKPRLEAAAVAVTGMEVSVNGRLGVGFFPGLRVTLEDVHIRNRGTELVTASKVRIGVDFLALLKQDVRIRNVVFEHPSITIERGRDGRFNYERTDAVRGPLPGLSLAKVSFSDGTFRYLDRQSGKGFEAAGCSLDANRLQLAERDRPGIMKYLSLSAEIVCGTVRTKEHAASDLKMTVAGKRGIFDITPLTMRAYSGQGSGNLRADFTGAVPRYHLSYILSQFHVDAFLKPMSPKNAPEGSADITANLSMQGKTVKNMRQTLQGQVSLRGRSLLLKGRDLDQEFARFESSQTFNLVDVGAFFFAGPVGLAVTKGYNFANILQGSEGRSEIQALVSDWKVERGVALSRDVAIATNKNRVALQGRLDFVNERFDDVTVALIDDKGCIRAQQTIHGAFEKPVVENPSTLKALTGPVVSLLKQVEGLFPGGACDVFYAGSVAPPE
ncbi:MAG: AsmA family protein [Gammaproteobacteria bacterium]|nr:AsmA family protein [Gammaproteobacteria bacterium]MBU1407664.1 AsmA family protein [Gammaproteobacteria bacterium]MBU1531777.1 AsmA family protein [Gammaproteobacteria bacterium]